MRFICSEESGRCWPIFQAVAKLRFGEVAVPARFVRVSALCCSHPAHPVSDDVASYTCPRLFIFCLSYSNRVFIISGRATITACSRPSVQTDGVVYKEEACHR